MTDHRTGTREEWLAARKELLEEEKEFTRRGDGLVRRRQELPWLRVDKEYCFETDDSPASLVGLFEGRSQLMIYHFMFGPEYMAGCPSCSAIADGFDGSVVHLLTTTSASQQFRVRRSRSSKSTSGEWAGTSRGRRRSGAISTTTSA